jgi:hypothetical protein
MLQVSDYSIFRQSDDFIGVTKFSLHFISVPSAHLKYFHNCVSATHQLFHIVIKLFSDNLKRKKTFVILISFNNSVVWL